VKNSNAAWHPVICRKRWYPALHGTDFVIKLL
jgi:hypothetical protein